MTPLDLRNPSRRQVVLGAGATSAGAALLTSRAANAAAPLLGTQVPGWYRFKVGDFECTVVSDGPLAPTPVQALYPPIMEDEFAKLLTERFQPGRLLFDQNALVVNTGRDLVLFDTGGGTIRPLGPKTGQLLGNLHAASIDPAQIDTVVITQAHADHCWALMAGEGRPTFPNAKVVISKEDFDYWTDEARMSSNELLKTLISVNRRHLLPVRDRTTFIEDGREVVPGITAMATPGHTVGHMSFVIGSGSSALMLTADVVHHFVLSLERPRRPFSSDTDAQEAIKTRVRVLDMLASSRMPALVYHFPFPGLGNVSKVGEGYMWHPAPWQVAL